MPAPTTTIIPGPVIVPTDWLEYARYFLLSKIPQLGGPDRATDLDDSGLDWSASANAGFPASDTGGTLQLSTVFLAGAIGFATPKFPVNNQAYISTMLGEPWGFAARTKGLTATANSRLGLASMVRLGGSATLTLGVNGPQSIAFISAWTTNGAALSNIVPVLTTIPYLGNGVYHELYGTYNGNVVELWGGGNFRRGIEPLKGGEYTEHSTLLNVSCTAGITVQSINGVTTEVLQSGSVLGKCILVP